MAVERVIRPEIRDNQKVALNEILGSRQIATTEDFQDEPLIKTCSWLKADILFAWDFFHAKIEHFF